MPSIACKNMRWTTYLLLILIGFLLNVTNIFAENPPAGGGGGTGEGLETAERIRVLEAQKMRQDERASLWGGTGLVFTRTAILLPRKHLNFSTYFDYSHYQYIQGWRPTIKLDDPRADDMELFIVTDYGLTHWAELSMFMNVFLDDEQGDPNQLHMRKTGIGWSGINSKFRLLDIDKDGLGVATTFFLRFPSPDSGSRITSDEMGYGAELNVSLKLVAIAEWLDKFSVHGNLGFAHIDYFDTQLAGLYQYARTDELLNYYKNHPGKYREDHSYKYSDLFPSAWDDKDDVTDEHPYFATDHYTGSFALEIKPYLGVSTGVEFVGYRMLDFSDDNLQLAPFLTYTFRQIPFLKQTHRDLITLSAAGNIGMRSMNRSAPQWGFVTGITWHTDLLF